MIAEWIFFVGIVLVPGEVEPGSIAKFGPFSTVNICRAYQERVQDRLIDTGVVSGCMEQHAAQDALRELLSPAELAP